MTRYYFELCYYSDRGMWLEPMKYLGIQHSTIDLVVVVDQYLCNIALVTLNCIFAKTAFHMRDLTSHSLCYMRAVTDVCM